MYVGRYIIMAEGVNCTNEFHYENLSNNPNFNFLNTLHNSLDSDNFNSFFSGDNNESPYDSLDIHCTYSSVTDCTHTNDLTVLSLNIQSLNAKYSDLKDLIHEIAILTLFVCKNSGNFPLKPIFLYKDISH